MALLSHRNMSQPYPPPLATNRRKDLRGERGVSDFFVLTWFFFNYGKIPTTYTIRTILQCTWQVRKVSGCHPHHCLWHFSIFPNQN